MVRNLIVLADGTEIYSGPGTVNAVLSAKLTQSVNSDMELTLGSVCADCLEVKLLTPGNVLQIENGTEFYLYKVDDATSVRTKVGVFIAEKPTRTSANVLQLTAYSRIVKLEKDLTEWLDSLDAWPYTLLEFTQMVCTACGLTLITREFPNSDITISRFVQEGVTGRRLMEYAGELACRFVRANPDGNVEFGWYEESGVTVHHSGESYYKSLSYEDYDTAPIDTVQVRLASSNEAYLWPEAGDGSNAYVVVDNPLMPQKVGDEMMACIATMEAVLREVSYRPCKITLPLNGNVRAGSILTVQPPNGSALCVYVMSYKQIGQMVTLECTGSARRDGPSVKKSQREKDAQYKRFAARVAENAELTQEEAFNALTNGGTAQGVYLENGQLYINASYLKSGVISADLIKAGVLQSADGETFRLDLDKGTFSMKGSGTFGGAGEGETYIRVDGSELCVYDEQGVPTIRIGQHRSNAMFQLPYIKFFTRRTESSLVDSPGMIFRTPLGLWIGNAEVDMDTLSDTVGVGLTDSSAGIFISTVEDKVYVVSGKQLQNVYTGEAVARFA